MVRCSLAQPCRSFVFRPRWLPLCLPRPWEEKYWCSVVPLQTGHGFHWRQEQAQLRALKSPQERWWESQQALGHARNFSCPPDARHWKPENFKTRCPDVLRETRAVLGVSERESLSDVRLPGFESQPPLFHSRVAWTCSLFLLCPSL